MFNYKIVLNGQGGYFFCSLIKKEIVDQDLKNFCNSTIKLFVWIELAAEPGPE